MSTTRKEEYGENPMTFVDYLVRFFKPYADRPRLREEVEEALDRIFADNASAEGREVCGLDECKK